MNATINTTTNNTLAGISDTAAPQPWARDMLWSVQYALRVTQSADERLAGLIARAYGLGSPGAPSASHGSGATGSAMERNVIAMLMAEDNMPAWAQRAIADAEHVLSAAEASVAADPGRSDAGRAQALEALYMTRLRYLAGLTEAGVAALTGYDGRTVRRRVAYAIGILDSRSRAAWLAMPCDVQ